MVKKILIIGFAITWASSYSLAKSDLRGRQQDARQERRDNGDKRNDERERQRDERQKRSDDRERRGEERKDEPDEDEKTDTESEDLQVGKGGEIDSKSSDYSPQITMGQASFSGSGCTARDSQAILNPDNTVVSLIFDSFQVASGGNNGPKKDRKNCNIRIPFNVPEGFRVAIIKVDFRGFSQSPEGGKNKLVTNYQISDLQSGVMAQKTVKRHKWFKGPHQEDFVLNTDLTRRLIWTKCGQDFNLHMDSQLVAFSNSKLEQAQISIDSIDMTRVQIGYHLIWRKCQ